MSGQMMLFYVQQSVGKARYVVSFHDGTKRHKDGSPFYDIRICHNAKEKDIFVRSLKAQGFIERW